MKGEKNMADEQAMTSGTNNRFKIIAGIMVALIIGGAAFYFLYWKKTPEQAAANIALAVKQHDVALFYISFGKLNYSLIPFLFIASILKYPI